MTERPDPEMGCATMIEIAVLLVFVLFVALVVLGR